MTTKHSKILSICLSSIFIMSIILKLTHIINYSWWLILSPLWISASIICAILTGFVLIVIGWILFVIWDDIKLNKKTSVQPESTLVN